MDISSITDINQLKSLAYDSLIAIEQQQQNLRILQERISLLQNDNLSQEPAKKAR